MSPDLFVVMKRLGHEDIRTTINRYGHLLPNVDAAMAQGLDSLYVKSIAEPEPAPVEVLAVRQAPSDAPRPAPIS